MTAIVAISNKGVLHRVVSGKFDPTWNCDVRVACGAISDWCYMGMRDVETLSGPRCKRCFGEEVEEDETQP